MIFILLYFILGILLVQVGFPLMEGITSLLLTMIEAAKGYFGMKVTMYNNRIQEVSNESLIDPIGFRYEEEDDE